MKSLIVTVAGTATRFNRDTDNPTLKCLYHESNPSQTLLSQIILKSQGIDEIIIVGGYLYDNLKQFVKDNLSEYEDKIKLVYNPEFETWGSGYSLILGIRNVSPKADEIIFVEGDLYFDRDDYLKVIRAAKNVLTVNYELIRANKAVVVYENKEGHLRYLYDTGHKALEIKESFIAIYNSAQIWKFINPEKLREVIDGLNENQIKGTNLEIIQGYFGSLVKEDYEIIPIREWNNCNTIDDYRKIQLNDFFLEN